MKKLICTSLLALAVSTANAAPVATNKSGFYVKGEVGASIFHDPDTRKALSTLPVFGLGVGYKFNPMFRLDLNGHYKQKSIGQKTGAFYDTSLSLYYDIETGTILTPYITAGGGATFLQNRAGSTSETDAFFSWNAGLGSKVQLSKDLDLDLGYRFVGLTNKADTRGVEKYNTHQITLGLIWNI